MSLDPGTQHAFNALEAYKQGKLGNEFIQAQFACILRNQPAIRTVGNGYQRTTFDATSTATQVKGGAGNLFKIRVKNGSTSKVVVDILDGTVLRQRLFCPAGVSATDRRHSEGIWATDTNGAGTEYDTSIQVKAFLASDGTTTAAANVTVDVDWN